MQVMPPTGRQLNVGDTKVEANISHAGVRSTNVMMGLFRRSMDRPLKAEVEKRK